MCVVHTCCTGHVHMVLHVHSLRMGDRTLASPSLQGTLVTGCSLFLLFQVRRLSLLRCLLARARLPAAHRSELPQLKDAPSLSGSLPSCPASWGPAAAPRNPKGSVCASHACH